MADFTSGSTKRDIIAAQLRQLISSGEIPRGSRMRQVELAERFQTSITPVREALRLLEAEGILEGEPRRGVRVASVDLRELKKTYILRRLLEPYVMMRAGRRVSARDLQRARELLCEMQSGYGQNDDATVRAANYDFHFLFIDLCGIPQLAREIESLWNNYPWDILTVLRDRVPHSISEHADIISAMESGDLKAIAHTTELHLVESYFGIVQHLTGDIPNDPFELDVD